MTRKLLPFVVAIIAVAIGASIIAAREARRRRELWAEATD